MTIIENPGSKVLYPNAEGMEKALADTDAVRLMSVYAEAVIDVWDPYKISLTNLPFLAYGMSVNMWQDDWAELTKRNWVANNWTFLSLRGTVPGLRMAVEYMGRDVSPFGYQV